MDEDGHAERSSKLQLQSQLQSRPGCSCSSLLHDTDTVHVEAEEGAPEGVQRLGGAWGRRRVLRLS